MIRAISVYQREGTLYVESKDTVGTGALRMVNAWHAQLPASTTDAELGAAVRDGFAHCRQLASRAEAQTFRGGALPVQRAAKARSEVAFTVGTQAVFATLDDERGSVRLQSSAAQPDGGFLAEEGMYEDCVPDDLDDAALGAAVRGALAQSR